MLSKEVVSVNDPYAIGGATSVLDLPIDQKPSNQVNKET